MTKKIVPDFDLYAITHQMHGLIPQSRRYVMDKNILSHMKVLDVGCGDGQHLEYLSQRIQKQNLFGTEISNIRVNRVIKKGFNCIKVDGVTFPFERKNFDSIIFFEVIEHISEKDVDFLFTEFCKVLNENGIVIGSTPNYPAKRFYSLFNRIKNYIKHKFNENIIQKTNNTEESEMHITPCSSSKTSKKKDGWIKRKIGRLFADDPTHQFFCNFNIINRLGMKYFKEVELYTTFSGNAKKIKINNLIKYFSHKIVFVFRAPR